MQEIKQALFDRAVKGLASQGFEPSFLPGGDTCAYRGEDGKRCAVGHLMPDEAYRPEMEGRNIRDLVEDMGFDLTRLAGAPPALGEAEQGELADFLLFLQGCHDAAYRPGTMRNELRDFAEEHGLTLPPVLRLP